MVGILRNKKLTKEQELIDDWAKDTVGRLHAYAIFVSLANQRHVINTFLLLLLLFLPNHLANFKKNVNTQCSWEEMKLSISVE